MAVICFLAKIEACLQSYLAGYFIGQSIRTCWSKHLTIEMPNADRCFGLGGSFSITHYDVSQKIADHKVDAIMAIGLPNRECGIIAGGQDRRDRERTRHSSR